MEEISKILKNRSDFYFLGNKSESEIEEAENALQLSITGSFRKYLSEFGNINFGSFEYYGLTKNSNFNDCGIPNFVWFTLTKRKQINFPTELIIFSNRNDEIYYCLYPEKPNSPVVEWDNINKVINTEHQILFSEFLKDEVDEYLEEYA